MDVVTATRYRFERLEQAVPMVVAMVSMFFFFFFGGQIREIHFHISYYESGVMSLQATLVELEIILP